MSTGPSIVNSDDSRLISLIDAAQERVVFVAPGASEPVAQALAQKWLQLGPQAVQVVLDVDPEVCRLGYGTLEGLKLLRECASSMQNLVCHHPGIRIGLLIADETTLVYSPTPLLIEAGSTSPERPNAILLNTPPAEVLRDMGMGEEGEASRVIGLDGVESAVVQKVEADLAANPPLKFDLARTVRVLQAKLQFAELEMTGIYISRKRVKIPSNLIGLAHSPDVERQFHAHFNLVSEAKLEVEVDDDHVLTEESLRKAKEAIVRDFLIQLTGYGMVVLCANKREMEEAVEALKTDVETFQKGVEKDLQKHIDANIEALVEALFPAVKENPPKAYTKFSGPAIRDEDLREMLKGDIRKAFGEAKSLVKEMKVSLVFKNLSSESLKDEKFLEVACKAIPNFESMFKEFDAVEAAEEQKETAGR